MVKHVGDALFSKSPKAKSDIVCIGFSPWGVIEGRENLIGVNVRIDFDDIISHTDVLTVTVETCLVSFKSHCNEKQCYIE